MIKNWGTTLPGGRVSRQSQRVHSRFWPLWPQTGNCQLWPFWQLHIETLDSEPRQGPVWQPHLGPVWQLPIWVRMAPHIGTCHSGHSWQLPLGPRVAATCLFIVIYYFFYFLYKNEKIRWFPCGTWRHSSSFIVKMVWGCTAGFIFSFLSL